MTYLRWIKKKNGKLIGPYIYKSVRIGKTVVGKYIRKANPEDKKRGRR